MLYENLFNSFKNLKYSKKENLLKYSILSVNTKTTNPIKITDFKFLVLNYRNY